VEINGLTDGIGPVPTCFSYRHFTFVYLAYYVTGRKERIQNDLFCVEWDVKP